MRDWGRGEHALWWEVVARNKKSVSINLRVPEGQAQHLTTGVPARAGDRHPHPGHVVHVA